MTTVVETNDAKGNFVLTVTVPGAAYAAFCTAFGVSQGQLGATILANAQSTVAGYQQMLIMQDIRTAAAKGNLAQIVAAFQEGGALAGTQ